MCEVDKSGTLRWVGELAAPSLHGQSINAVYFQCIVASEMLQFNPVLVNCVYLCSEFKMKKTSSIHLPLMHKSR